MNETSKPRDFYYIETDLGQTNLDDHQQFRKFIFAEAENKPFLLELYPNTETQESHLPQYTAYDIGHGELVKSFHNNHPEHSLASSIGLVLLCFLEKEEKLHSTIGTQISRTESTTTTPSINSQSQSTIIENTSQRSSTQALEENSSLAENFDQISRDNNA